MPGAGEAFSVLGHWVNKMHTPPCKSVLHIFDDTRSVESLISAECEKLDFPVLHKQLCHPRFASGSQCMTSMTVMNKRHFNPSCSRLAIR